MIHQNKLKRKKKQKKRMFFAVQDPQEVQEKIVYLILK